jgi:hypothetical protein
MNIIFGHTHILDPKSGTQPRAVKVSSGNERIVLGLFNLFLFLVFLFFQAGF